MLPYHFSSVRYLTSAQFPRYRPPIAPGEQGVLDFSDAGIVFRGRQVVLAIPSIARVTLVQRPFPWRAWIGWVGKRGLLLAGFVLLLIVSILRISGIPWRETVALGLMAAGAVLLCTLIVLVVPLLWEHGLQRVAVVYSQADQEMVAYFTVVHPQGAADRAGIQQLYQQLQRVQASAMTPPDTQESSHV